MTPFQGSGAGQAVEVSCAFEIRAILPSLTPTFRMHGSSRTSSAIRPSLATPSPKLFASTTPLAGL